MGQQTALYSQHVALNARMVDFGGWDMPVQYQSVLDEHHAVRRNCGMFDVSHMTLLELAGPDTVAFLQRILANDVAKLDRPGKALYALMLNEQGGVIDDLIVYAPTISQPDRWLMIVNCGTHDKDLQWLTHQAASFRVTMTERTDLAMIAVQGPNALDIMTQVVLPSAKSVIQGLDNFQGADLDNGWFVAKTGYTGEAGVELILPNDEVAACWQKLLDAGVKPCGLGARDTLRLEAGMPLYGNDMTEQTLAIHTQVAWSISWNHDFIGKKALQAAKQAQEQWRVIGLILEDRGVLRPHMKVTIAGAGEGETTSGTFSPTLDRAIAFARVPATEVANIGSVAYVDIRGRQVPARIVKPVFVRAGKVVTTL
jgi:aminomethyltransferase